MNRQFDGTKNFDAKDSNYPMPLAALANGCSDVRISKCVAQEWIIHQQTVVYQSTVHYLILAYTGIGTYLVRRADVRHRRTELQK